MTLAGPGSDLVTSLLVPPQNLALLAALSLASGRAAGRWLAAACVVALVALSTPLVAGALIASLEAELPGAASAVPPEAIIVLGAEAELDAGPAASASPGPLTLERLRAGAILARRTGLPLLVSGGVVREGAPPVAEIMAQSLAADFGLTARWVEPRSADTWRNARDSAAILVPLGIRRVYVVSHAWHLRRAMIAFAGSGLLATPAPVRLDPAPTLEWQAVLPRASAWQASYYALHEWIGGAWYAWRRARA